MATYTKRNGNRGVRWEARIRRKSYLTLTKTFSLKSDAESWVLGTELNLARGTYNSQCQDQTLGDILSRYAQDVTPNKRGAEQETFRIRKLLRNPITDISVLALLGFSSTTSQNAQN